nr:hypothetical protein RWETBTHO_RWETBTHO_CDS_0005 [Microvirus sp.]
MSAKYIFSSRRSLSSIPGHPAVRLPSRARAHALHLFLYILCSAFGMFFW